MKYRGIYGLLVTPFQADGTVDWDAYRAVIEHHHQAGVHGIFGVCGTSQMALLTADERLELARRAVEWSSVPVVVSGNVDPDAARHEDEVRRMAATGVDGIVLIPPPETPANNAALKAYYGRLADANPVDTLMYEWPGRKPHHFCPPEVYEDLAKEHGVKGIKDTTCTLDGIQAKIDRRGDSTIFQANMANFVPSLRTGADGMMAIVSAGCPTACVALWDAFQQGDEPQIAELDALLIELDASLKDHPRSSQYLLSLQGVPIEPRVRGRSNEMPSAVRDAMDAWWAKAAPLLAGRATA